MDFVENFWTELPTYGDEFFPITDIARRAECMVEGVFDQHARSELQAEGDIADCASQRLDGFSGAREIRERWIVDRSGC